MKKQVFNPYLPSYEYIPDGEPHVFDGRLYIYGSHDRFNGADFCLNDYICYSADVKDLTDWRYEGVIFRKDQDPRNQNIPADTPPQRPGFAGFPDAGPEQLNPPGVHAMFAPDVVKGLDGRYYLYYCLDCLSAIGVAVCDSPAGKYEFLDFVRHEDGTVLGEREGDLLQFDPGIFIDDDDTIYLYSGNAPIRPEHIRGGQDSQVMKLKRDMVTLAQEPRPLIPTIVNSEGTGYEGHEFFEASSIRKINGKYYFVYSSVRSHELCYAVSDRPDEGYVFGGTLVDIGDVFLNGRTEKESVNHLGNTHGGMEQADGQWYIFYHRQTNRTQYSRQGCAEKLYFREDGSIPQVEVTSCGLNHGPLDGVGMYPAYICCALTGKDGAAFSHPLAMQMKYPYLTQEGEDVEPVSPGKVENGLNGHSGQEEGKAAAEKELPCQYIANVADGTLIGYKYFKAGELKQIKVRIRGNATGSLYVKTAPDGENIGEIPVEAHSSAWTQTAGNVSLSADSQYALYFKYEGDGAFDFMSFELS